LGNLHQCRLQNNNFEKLSCSQNWLNDLTLSCKGGLKNMANVIVLGIDLEKRLEKEFEGVIEKEFDVWCTSLIGEIFRFPTSLHFYMNMKKTLHFDVIIFHWCYCCPFCADTFTFLNFYWPYIEWFLSMHVIMKGLHHKFIGFVGSFQIHAKFVISWVCIV
jgi:hypothetical protein